jgi:broad specificity phosphatase PhoE
MAFAGLKSSLSSGARLCLAALLSLCLLAPGTAPAAELLDDDALLAALREGGHNIYFRHVATDWSLSDDVRDADDLRSCDPERMRQLSAAGRADATAIGEAMRRLRIPVSEVKASPYCRTVETAKLMQLGEVIESDEVMNMRAAGYVGGRSRIVETAQALLSSKPPQGGNRVIVAHGNVARESTPYYPGEGEGLVFQPDDAGGFALRGRIRPSDWKRLMVLE